MMHAGAVLDEDHDAKGPDPAWVRRFLTDGAEADGAPPSAAEDAMLGALEACLARYRERYGDVFEASVSSGKDGVSRLRFSYAFPGLREKRDEVAGLVRGLAAPLGEAAQVAAEKTLRAAQHPAVEQLLFGYARDGDGTVRTKFYLQFADAAGDIALRLGRAVTGYPGWLASESLPLHLIGIDIGDSGLVGAKLYFLLESLPADDTERLLGVPVAIERALMIHRIRGPHDADAGRVSEIDFACSDGPLEWEKVRAWPAVSGHQEALAFLDGLRERYASPPSPPSHQGRVRRVSLSLLPANKLNVYYALDTEESSGAAEPTSG